MKKVFLGLVLVPTVLLAFWPQSAPPKSAEDKKPKATTTPQAKPTTPQAKPAKKMMRACGTGNQPAQPTYIDIHITAPDGTVSPDPATLHTDKDERARFVNDTAVDCGVSFNPSATATKNIPANGGDKKMPKVVGPCAQYAYFVQCAAPMKKHKDHDKDKDDSAKPAGKGDPVIIVTP